MNIKIKSFKDFALLVLKGVAVGIAMLIPGISGGTLALMLGIYEDTIESVAGIRKHFKDSILFLIPLAIGALLGYLALVKLVSLGLTYIPIPTITLFVGFIIGGLPSIFRNVKGAKINVPNVLCLVIAFVLAAGLGVLSQNLGLSVKIEDVNIWSYILILVGGILAAFALVVPGISGSAVLLALGLYELVVIVSIPNVIKFNFANYLPITLVFAVGALIGLLCITKLMKFLLKNHTIPTFFAIIGFIIGSIFSVYYNHEVISKGYYDILTNNPWQYALMFGMLVVGIIIALLLDKLVNKSDKEKEEVTNEAR